MPKTKYILIERPEHHLTAVSHAVLADMVKRGTELTVKGPVTISQIKKDRINVYEDSHYKQHVAFDDWYKEMHGRVLKAKVDWFDLSTGVGYVSIVGYNNIRLTIFACNINGHKTWYPETACVFYMQGEIVDVQLDVHPGQTFVIGLTPGYIDEEKWERIKDTDLAFRCDEHGKPVTGLFK